MEAKEKALTFLREQIIYIVPYFQRGYVWDEENWEGIWQELTAKREDCFLGSIILKKEQYPGRTEVCKTIIDGQQRLTTLTILLRAFMDYYIKRKGVNPDDPALLYFRQLIFYPYTKWTASGIETTERCRIDHSRLNKKDYTAIIEGSLDPETLAVNTAPKQGAVTSKLLRCYKYFYDKLCEASDDDISMARSKLIIDDSKILVVIDLVEKENEQVIFDTINSTGVMLTASDIIKNALFQKVKSSGRDIELLYEDTWQKCFEDSSDTVALWMETKGLGQNKRSNIDLFFYSFAIIKGFFHVPKDKMADLASKYKEHIAALPFGEDECFLREICEYADLYRETFISFNDITGFSFSENRLRLLQILRTVNITAFDPFILFVLKNYEESKQDAILAKLECYVMRHYIIGNSSKMGSFLQDAVKMIGGTFDFDEELSDDSISNIRLERALRYINNTKAKLVLFWIELYRHTQKESDLYDVPLAFKYELEHVMPQKWQTHWSLAALPIVKDDGSEMTVEEGTQIRSEAVYEIGNMTLLTAKLNKELQNYAFSEKVKGAVIGKKERPGMDKFAALSITKEIINRDPLVWNEESIYARTKEMINCFEIIWPCG